MCEDMAVVVNVMFSLMSVMSLVHPIGTHGGEVMYFGYVCFRDELSLLNCDYIIYMCVVNKQFESLDFFIPFMLTCSMMRILSLLLLGLCPCVVSVVM